MIFQQYFMIKPQKKRALTFHFIFLNKDSRWNLSFTIEIIYISIILTVSRVNFAKDGESRFWNGHPRIRRYIPLTSIWILGTIPFSSRRSGQATMETNGRTLTGGSNLEVFPGQPRASGREEEEGRGEGDEEVRWLYDGQGVSGLRGGRGCEKVS